MHTGVSLRVVVGVVTAALLLSGCGSNEPGVRQLRASVGETSGNGFVPEAPAKTPSSARATSKPSTKASKKKNKSKPKPSPKPSRTKKKRNCDPAYKGQCLKANAYDYDCAGGSGDGPFYVFGPVRVVGWDRFDLDRDGDGWGCEDS